jgi:hypothetical protein
MSKLQRKRKGLDYRSGEPKKLIVFSLKDFDINQGQSFEDWEKNKILSNLMTRLREISSFSITEAQQNGILTIYRDFPSKSDFRHPRHIPQGVNWAVISIQGKERIAGYVEDNIFYIVFLDKDHKFWITEKKHT